MNIKSCFFTGHRSFSCSRNSEAAENLVSVLIELIEKGVTDFYAGGAIGWDMYCEQTVLKLKEKYPKIKLHMVLPCSPAEQTLKWSEHSKREYEDILKCADSIDIVAERYHRNCMRERNARLTELGDICVCYFDKKDTRSGTAQTIRMAREAQKTVINICQTEK